MIRKQFLEGFRYKGEELNESDKKYLYNTPELDDLVQRAMYIVRDNEEKRRRMKKISKDRRMDRQNKELSDCNVEAARQNRPTYDRQWETNKHHRPNPSFVAQMSQAEPSAQRVTFEEYKKGRTNEGERVCYHCCLPNHIAKQCPNDSFCMHCGEETNHPSVLHPSQAPRIQNQKDWQVVRAL